MPEAREEQGTLVTELAVYPTLRRWVDGFFVSRRAQGVADSTLKFYAQRFHRFIAFCDLRSVSAVEAIDPNLIREFFLHLEETGHNPGGVHGYYRTLKTFLRWYEVEAEPEGWRNPIKRVKAPRVPEELLEPVDLADVARMAAACKDDKLGLRDRAMLLVLLDAGLRASELTALDVGDFDAVTGELKIRRGKGGKGRTVFVGQKTRKAIRSYLRVRGPAPGPLFLTRTRRRLTYAGLRTTVQHCAAAAGVHPPPPLHAFRRAFALELLRSGADLLSVQRLLGHADLSVLRRYVKQTTGDLQATHAAHSPVDRAGM